MPILTRPASNLVVDFSNDDTLPIKIFHNGGKGSRTMNDKQIRARARRHMKIAVDEIQHLYGKPVEDWDVEELARGRCKDKRGRFSGPNPGYMSTAVHERIVERFTVLVKKEMSIHTVDALVVLGHILNDNETDEKGRFRTTSGTKLDAAKFLIEHTIGKPKQHMETDISVKLQGILGMAMVNPQQAAAGQYQLAQGYVEAPSWEADDDESAD